jgi:hypothetical protein
LGGAPDDWQVGIGMLRLIHKADGRCGGKPPQPAKPIVRTSTRQFELTLPRMLLLDHRQSCLELYVPMGNGC